MVSCRMSSGYFLAVRMFVLVLLDLSQTLMYLLVYFRSEVLMFFGALQSLSILGLGYTDHTVHSVQVLRLQFRLLHVLPSIHARQIAFVVACLFPIRFVVVDFDSC